MASLVHYLGARVEVLIDPMAKTHEPERIVFILGLFHEFGDVLRMLDLFEHV